MCDCSPCTLSFNLQIEVHLVQNYQRGTFIPHIVLEKTWSGSGKPEDEKLKVILTGVSTPQSFKLKFTSKKAIEG